MNKTASIIVTVAIVVVIFIIFVYQPNGSGNNVEVKNGVQYVNIDARGGYFPRVSKVKPGIPTKIIMKTKGTYDCSAALVIRSLNYQGILPQNAQTEIDAGVFAEGDKLDGLCSMGMYSFTIEAD